MLEIFWKPLIIACILVLLIYILYYFGILVSRAGVSLFRAEVSLPTRWEGKFAETTGFQQRNFAVFQRYSTLVIEIETNSGSLGFEVKTPDGSTLLPTSGVYGRDSSVLIDVSCFRRCSVALRMDRFNGQFRIMLQ